MVRADTGERSVCSLKSPFFVFLFPHQFLLHLCGVRPMQQDLWTQEKRVLGASSSCAESQPVLGSGVADERITKLIKSPEKFSLLFAWVVENEHQSSAFAKRY